MKKLLLAAGLLLALQACQSQPETFEVSFNLTGIKDGKVKVMQRMPPKYESNWIDEIPVKDGKAVYTGSQKYATPTLFCVMTQDKGNSKWLNVLLDNSRIEVTGDLKSDKELQAQGSRAEARTKELDNKYKTIKEQMRTWDSESTELYVKNQELYVAALERHAGKGGHFAFTEAEKAEMAKVQKTIDSLDNLSAGMKGKFMEKLLQEPDVADNSAVAYYIFSEFGYDTEHMPKAIKAFSPDMLQNPFIARSCEVIQDEKRIQPGQMAMDFEMPDLDGKMYKLSDYRGKYVLLVFSSSGCGWCKKELPFLKEVYENTKGKDFAMFTVDTDWSREHWEEVVKAYNAPWPIISDLKSDDSPLQKGYNIKGVPSTYLLDKEGKFLKNELRGGELIDYINRLFEK